jgi:hypothetical protein
MPATSRNDHYKQKHDIKAVHMYMPPSGSGTGHYVLAFSQRQPLLKWMLDLSQSTSLDALVGAAYPNYKLQPIFA